MTEIIVLIVYALLILYTLSQLNHWLKKISQRKPLRFIFDIVYILAALLPIGGCYMSQGSLKNAMIANGNVALGFFIYFGLCLLFFHIVRIIGWLAYHPHKGEEEPQEKRHPWTGLLVIFLCVLISLTLVTYGNVNAHKIHTTEYNVTLSKKTSTNGELKIVLVSDLHLDTNSYEDQLKAMVREISKQDADIVVIAGDTFSGSYDAIPDPEGKASILRGIKSKQGVYAVYGDQDVDGKLLLGFNVSHTESLRTAEMEEFFTNAGIQVLDDKTIFINGVQIVGRLDGEETGTGEKRASIASLTESLDTSMPVLVIQHEPNDFNNLSASGVDLVLSGGTLAGQFFPVNIAMSLVSENSYGLQSIHNVYSVVTSGAGYYGPPMRLGTHSEIAVVNLSY